MPFTHSVNLGVPNTFSDVDMFLQSLTSEESSDADSYDFFSPDSQQVRSQGYTGTSGPQMRSQIDSVPQGAFDPQYLHTAMPNGKAGAAVAGSGSDRTSKSALSSLGTSPQTVGPQSLPLDQINSFGSSASSSNNYTDPYNNSPFDMSDSELRPAMTNNTDLLPQVSVKTEGFDGDMLKNVNVKMEEGNFGPINMINGPSSSSPADSQDSGSSGHGKYSSGKVGKPKKERTSHNVIEKKYRTNINNKIVQLKEIIPSLCVTMKREENIPVTELDQLRLDGLQPAKKLNKASILVKTIEYIQHLEDKVDRLKYENDQLKQSQTFSTPLSVRNNSTSDSIIGMNTNISSNTTPSYNANFASAYPNGTSANAGSSFTNKMLMGGLAMTMGATCFNGENNDFQTARGLMAMPVFHYSPVDGFTVSNSNGIINVQSTLISLMRLTLLLFTALHFMSQFINHRESNKSKNSETNVLVPYLDNMKFTSNATVVETLKKTMFINRLKYPENSMERIENEIVKCFAIKMWQSPFKFLVSGQVDKTWESLISKVNAINDRNQAIENSDWSAITTILEAATSETLDNEQILSQLAENKEGYSLSGFVQSINNSIINQKLEIVINEAVKQTFQDVSNKDELIDQIFHSKIKSNEEYKSLGLAAVLDCIFEPTEANIGEFTAQLKMGRNVSKLGSRKDSVLILYSSIISCLISQKKFSELSYWINNLPIQMFDKNTTLLSVVSLKLTIEKLLANKENIHDLSQISPKLEYISGKLRIWIGSDSGNTFHLDVRGQLVDFFVDAAMKFNSFIDSEEENDANDYDYDEDDDDLFDDDEDDDQFSDQTDLDVSGKH